MSAPFSVRDYRVGDEQAVLGLLRESLGDGRAFERSTVFWHWKHFQNPFGPSLMMLAENTELMGLRAFMRWRFRVGGRTITAVRAVDTATHPAYRRHGVFSTLTRLMVERAQGEGVDLIFNTPNRYSLPGYLNLGWTHVGRPGVLIRIIRWTRVIRALRRSATTDGEPTPVAMPPRMESILARPDVLEPLLANDDRLCGRRIRTDRSVAFLRWRYASVPSLPYDARWSGPEPTRAVVIFRANQRRGLREVMLSELLLGSFGIRDVPALIRGLIREFEADYFVAHAPWGSRHWWALLRAGFLPIPRVGPHFTVRALSPVAVAASPARLAHWHLSLGDLEVF